MKSRVKGTVEAHVEKWARRPIRWVGALMLLIMPTACAFCIETTIHPEAESHAAFCAQYYQEGKLVEAEARCKLAREYSPKYAEPANLLGLIAYSRGQIGKARTLFKEAISLKEDFAEAHNNMGAIFMDERNYPAACDMFLQSVEIDPGYVNARVNLGLCLFYDGKMSKARNEYLKCVELDPNACDCRMGLGVLEMAGKRWDDARAQFQKLTEICPNMAEGYYNLGFSYKEMGKCAEAVNALTAAMSVKEDYIEAKQVLAESYGCLAMQDKALEQELKRLQRNPGDAGLHFKVGTIFEEKNLLEQALQEYLNAVKLDPKHELAHYRAARVFDRQLRTQETIEMCQRFVDLLRGGRFQKQREWCVARVQELQFQ